MKFLISLIMTTAFLLTANMSFAYSEQLSGAYNSTSRFPQKIPSMGNRIFMFSPKFRMWAAYDESGYRVGYGRANGGADQCFDLGGRPCKTPRGLFRVHTKGDVSCKSRKFPVGRGGAPMPYCMYFSGGYAIHGSPGISDFNSSHGCIRVTTTAASWLHQNFIRQGTSVLILPY